MERKFYYPKNRNRNEKVTLGTHFTKEHREPRWRRARGGERVRHAASLSLLSHGSNDLAECIKCGKTTSGVRTLNKKNM